MSTLIQNHEPSKLELTAIAIENKDAIQSYNQLYQRSQSVMFSSHQESSILGGISIDVSSSVIENAKKKSTMDCVNKSRLMDKSAAQFQPTWNNSTKNKVAKKPKL